MSAPPPGKQPPRRRVQGNAAFLRVYEPLDALPDRPRGQRARWQQLADRDTDAGAGATEWTDPAGAASREQLAALRALRALPPRVPVDADLTGQASPFRAGLLLTPALDDQPRICPVDLGWRSLRALGELSDTLSTSVLAALAPLALTTDAGREAIEFAMATAGNATASPHIRTSVWHVPLAWFTIVHPHQRVPLDGGRHEARARRVATDESLTAQPLRSVDPSVRYLAPMADARRSLARALDAARRSPKRMLPISELEELGRWLEDFHAKAVVELDYGGLSKVVADDVVGDASVTDVALAVAELRAGAADDALRRLADVRQRWDVLRANERSS